MFDTSIFIYNEIKKEIQQRGVKMTEQVKIYGTKWCPDCNRAKQVFARLGVPYEWVDIEQNPAAAAYVQKVNGGMRSVPTIVFPDGAVLVEPANAVLEKKLKG
ncbi:MAG: glutaredoxin domain-containing protein [Dehalococcoidales bacterium]|nr:glutaredoxin domain-containing protein [Dehalococcoidales bacterium]